MFVISMFVAVSSVPVNHEYRDTNRQVFTFQMDSDVRDFDVRDCFIGPC